jgi:hypothetical protein
MFGYQLLAKPEHTALYASFAGCVKHFAVPIFDIVWFSHKNIERACFRATQDWLQ